MDARYSVYRAKTDEPVLIHGTRLQCAKAMGVTLKSFDTIASRLLRNEPKCSKNWIITRDTEEE